MKMSASIRFRATAHCLFLGLVLSGCGDSSLKEIASNSNVSAPYPATANTMANMSMAVAPEVYGSGAGGQLDRGEGGDRYAEIEENPFLETRRAPLSTFSIDVDTASYANVRRFINDGVMPPKDSVRIEE